MWILGGITNFHTAGKKTRVTPLKLIMAYRELDEYCPEDSYCQTRVTFCGESNTLSYLHQFIPSKHHLFIKDPSKGNL